jgi:hypothetical protein
MSFAVYNGGDREIRGIVLALGISWVPDGGRANIPPDLAPLTAEEERVEIPRVRLLPGASQRLRIALSTPIPDREGGKFVPYVRVVSVSEL